MAKARGDQNTLDLLMWAPEVNVEAFEPKTIRAATLTGKISKAVTVILKDARDPEGKRLERQEIAARMSDYLGEKITAATLSAYASEAKVDHNISLQRAIALMVVTNDGRLLSLMAEPLEMAVIPKRFESAVEEAVLVEKREEIDARIAQSRKNRR